jgi:hypothetical protein
LRIAFEVRPRFTYRKSPKVAALVAGALLAMIVVFGITLDAQVDETSSTEVVAAPFEPLPPEANGNQVVLEMVRRNASRRKRSLIRLDLKPTLLERGNRRESHSRGVNA